MTRRCGVKRRDAYKITVKWTGEKWDVQCTVPLDQLTSEHPVSIDVPPGMLQRRDRATERRLLCKQDVMLYLPIVSIRERPRLERIMAGPPGPRTPLGLDTILLPIHLLEDLYLERGPTGSTWSAADCRCKIADGDRVYKSLNSAAKESLVTWTRSRTGAVNIFDRVVFEHRRRFLPLLHKRSQVLDGTPFPEDPDPGRGTPNLPGIDT